MKKKGILLILLAITIIACFFIVCSSYTNQSLLESKKEIMSLKDMIANQKVEIKNKNIEILKINTKLEKYKNLALSLEKDMDTIKNESSEVLTSKEYESELLESLSWIQSIAFENSKYPQLHTSTESEKKILQEIIKENILESNFQDKIILEYSFEQLKDNYFKIECIYYNPVNLGNENNESGLMKVKVFYITKSNQKYEII